MSIFYGINKDFDLKTISMNTKKQVTATIVVQNEAKKFPVFKIKGVQNYFATDGREYYMLGDLRKVEKKIMKNPAYLDNVCEKMLLPYTPITSYALPQNLGFIKLFAQIAAFVAFIAYSAPPLIMLYLTK